MVGERGTERGKEGRAEEKADRMNESVKKQTCGGMRGTEIAYGDYV